MKGAGPDTRTGLSLNSSEPAEYRLAGIIFHTTRLQSLTESLTVTGLPEFGKLL
jgi:hypothetical protein